jgi:hypothetical protein
MKTPNLTETPAPAPYVAPVALPPFAICYCTHPKQPHRRALYVSALPGENGADWGYTPDREGTPNPLAHYDGPARLDVAKPLNRYWQRRFAADCRRVGMNFHAIACRSEENARTQAGWPLVTVAADEPARAEGASGKGGSAR